MSQIATEPAPAASKLWSETPLRSHGLPHMVGLGIEFARSSFLLMLAHRIRYMLGVANYLIYVAVNYYLWDALYSSDPSGSVAGWTLDGLRTYVSINWIIRSAYFSNSDNILAAKINKGEIVADLLRPTPLLLNFYGTAAGEVVFRVLFMALPVMVAALFLFKIGAPVDTLHAVLFGYSVLLAFHIFFAINFLTGLCAAFTEKLQGFLWAKFILLQFLSGLLLPLEFFPPAAKAVMEILPFKGMAQTPMSVYLGRLNGAELWYEMIQQTVWTIVLMVMCQWTWTVVRRRLSVLGG